MADINREHEAPETDERFKSVRVFNDVHSSIKSDAKAFQTNFATVSRAQDRIWRKLPRTKKLDAIREAAVPA